MFYRTARLPSMTTVTGTYVASSFSIWLVGVSFVLFQFFLQLSSGVLISSIMKEMSLTAFEAGMLSAAFYFVYTSLQIPAGILFDIKNTRLLLTVSSSICASGCIFFAHSHTLYLLILGRLLIGGGAAFAFVGLSHLLRQHFPAKQFAFMIGLSETLGFLVTLSGIIGLALVINVWGWRHFIDAAAITGFGIAFLSWHIIPDNTRRPDQKAPFAHQIITIITSTKLWMTGLFAGLSFSVITVFGALWAIPFLQLKLSCTIMQASIVDSMLFFGTALSCPLFGYLAGYLKRRRPLMLFSCVSTALIIYLILFLPITSLVLMSSLMFLSGISCGAYMLAYSIGNELAPKEALSTGTGFINTLAMLTAPIMQPLAGYLLDISSHHQAAMVYHLHDWQVALSIIPAGLLVAGVLVFQLPEKPSSP